MREQRCSNAVPRTVRARRSRSSEDKCGFSESLVAYEAMPPKLKERSFVLARGCWIAQLYLLRGLEISSPRLAGMG